MITEAFPSNLGDQRWDEVWAKWDKPAWPDYTQIRLGWFRQRCLELLQQAIPRDGFVLEIGAGAGWVTEELYPLFSHGLYVCADVSPVALQKLRERIPGVQTRLMSELATFRGSADLVICGDVLEHVEDPHNFFSQISAVLKPDGYLLLTTPNRFVPILYLNRLLGREATGQPYDRPYSAREVTDLLVRYGFEVLNCELVSAIRRPKLQARSRMRNLVMKMLLAMTESYLALTRRDTRDAIVVISRYRN